MKNPGNYTLHVFDTKGKLLITEQFKDNYLLNIEKHTGGSYLIEVISEKNSEQIVRRIIKR
jgi:hypothetical protein